MPTAWYIVPYKRRPAWPPTRYPAIDDHTAQIRALAGEWTETEILGNRCIVKVRAPAAALEQLATLPNYKRLPKDRLDDPLADLPPAALTALRDEILDQGYTLAEIQARFPDANLANTTLGDVLRFMATRRRKPRWDPDVEEIVLDGPVQTSRPVDEVDRVIS
jgi:hypothetical protein